MGVPVVTWHYPQQGSLCTVRVGKTSLAPTLDLVVWLAKDGFVESAFVSYGDWVWVLSPLLDGYVLDLQHLAFIFIVPR